MKISRLLMAITFIILLIPTFSFAEALDGSKPLICSVIDVIECAPGGECLRSDAASVNLPYFVKVDVTEQTLKVPHQEGDERVSQIKMVTRHLDGKLILQGAEDGSEEEADAIGWTMSIDEEDGRMIFSASREQVAFVVFGACTLY
jgi:hypothetical protein